MLLTRRSFYIGAGVLVGLSYALVLLFGYFFLVGLRNILEDDFKIQYAGDLKDEFTGTVQLMPCRTGSPGLPPTSVFWFNSRSSSSYITLSVPPGIPPGTYQVSEDIYLGGFLYQNEGVYSFGGRDLISGHIVIDAFPKDYGQPARGSFQAVTRTNSGEVLAIHGDFDFIASSTFTFDCLH